MSKIKELQEKVHNLSPEEFAQFREWFYELENERWDKEIARDFQAGKFDQMIEKAQREFAQGKASEL